MRKDETKVARETIDYQLGGKRLRGRPRKRRFDGVIQDLRTLDVKYWREIIQDGEI